LKKKKTTAVATFFDGFAARKLRPLPFFVVLLQRRGRQQCRQLPLWWQNFIFFVVAYGLVH